MERSAIRPLICMDKMPKQLLSDTHKPLPVQPEQPIPRDYEYKREGVSDVFMLFEPLHGKRQMKITEQRRRVEWDEVMKKVSDEFHPDAEKIIVWKLAEFGGD
jgi:hypothetical protein